ncbi:universal stress protein [Sodalis sp. dw_96]|uniref:universal stress protein n=1 Tax=Sodalis sp. dw_96 TaxID=2719794 RepID=UPI001BD1FB63|nr:universal stress protein [Sodalis sp. dw_96]
MALKTIVVFIDISPDSWTRIDYAVKIARDHNAHLIGIFIAPTSWDTSIHENYSVGSAAIKSVTKFHRDQEIETSKTAKEFFDAAQASEKISSEFYIIKDSEVKRRINSFLLYADMIIAGNPGTNGLPKNWSAETILLANGVPFLLVPNGWTNPSGEIGKRVLLGWNGSREARRAITDSLPFLIAAQSVSVVEVDPDRHPDHGDLFGADLLVYLNRHGVKIIVDPVSSHGKPVASVLMEYVTAHQIDLIVLGAYSHSRSSEILFGGVTRSLLKTMTTPLLISH